MGEHTTQGGNEERRERWQKAMNERHFKSAVRQKKTMTDWTQARSLTAAIPIQGHQMQRWRLSR